MPTSTWPYFLFGVTFIALVLIEPSRNFLRYALDTVLLPILKVAGTWIWWAVIQVLDAHRVVFKNLIMPRSVIFKTLETEHRTRRD